MPLVGCNSLTTSDVLEQAAPGGKIAFDVVKVDDSVVATLAAAPKPAFEQRFKKYVPPPELKIGVGDTVSVVIWEASAEGLFGNSLTELVFPAGAAASALTGQKGTLAGVPNVPSGLAVSPDLVAALFGGGDSAGPGAAAQTLAGTVGLAAAAGALRGGQGAGDQGGSGLGAGSLGGGSLGAGGLGVSAGGAGSQDGGSGRRSFGGYDSASATAGAGLGRSGAAADTLRNRRVGELIDQASQSGRPGTRIPDQQVGPDGAISVPYVGRIAVAGRTPVEVERAIEKMLGTKAIEPQALVAVSRSTANSVTVAGEAFGGKRVPLSPGGDRLLQVIAAAGGPRTPPHDTYVRLSRGGVTASLPLATLVADPSQDIFAEPGDVLTVVRQPRSFSVFGATGKNTAINFNGDRLSLSEALAKAGGLNDDRADPQAVFLFRYEPVEIVQALGQPVASNAPAGLSPVVYRFDMKEAKSYLLAKNFPMHDKDILFVADAASRPVYRFFLALSQIVGPVETGLITCYYSSNC